MAAGGSTLRFSVEVAADQATGALNALSAAFNQAGIQARSTILGVGKSGASAAAATTGFNQLKTAASRGRESVMFLTSALQELGPAGVTAQRAVSGVVGALLVGGAAGGILLAVEGVRFLVDRFAETKKAAEEAAKAAAKLHEEVQKIAGLASGNLLKSELLLSGLSPEQVEASLSRMERESEIQDKINEILLTQLPIRRAILELEATRLEWGGTDEAALAARRAELSRLDTEVATLRRALADERQSAANTRVAKEAADRAKAAAAEWKKMREDFEKFDLEYWSREYRRLEEYEKKISEIQPMRDEAVKNTWLFDLAPKGTTPSLFPEVKPAGQYGSLGEDAAGARAAATAEIIAETDRANAELLAKQRAAGEEIAEAFTTPMIDAWAQTFAAIATGQANLRDLLRETLATMVKSVIDAALKQALAAKTVAMSNAAAGSSWGGPLLAIGAATAIGAVMTKLIGQMPSAAGGWGQVPADSLALIHKNEMILPADIAEPLRQTLRGGSGAMALPPIVIQTIDGPSTRDWLQHRGGAEEIFRAFDRATRDGVR